MFGFFGGQQAAPAAPAYAQSGNPYSQHLGTLQSHLDSKRWDYEQASRTIDQSRISRTSEIDESGMSVVTDRELREYCRNLADVLAPGEAGFARKLEDEIRAQRGRFQVGGLRPLMKVDAQGGVEAGCFSLVQVAAAWDRNDVSIHYIQKGCLWRTQPGTRAPDLAIMVNFYQYKAVQSLMAGLQNISQRAPQSAFAPQASSWASQPAGNPYGQHTQSSVSYTNSSSCRQSHSSWEPEPQEGTMKKFGLF